MTIAVCDTYFSTFTASATTAATTASLREYAKTFDEDLSRWETSRVVVN